MSYQLEKSIWTESDFDVMGWHDATLWSMMADEEAYEYLFDLDYIFQWVQPRPSETNFTFWVAPVTMVFHDVHSVRIDIESQSGAIEIADLHRGEAELTPNGDLTQRTYRFACQEGEIRLIATGYTLYVRRQPVHRRRQSLWLAERNGISFARGATAA